MTKRELDIVLAVLRNIKPREDGGIHGKVQLAIRLIEKDILVRKTQADNFKDMYEYDDISF